MPINFEKFYKNISNLYNDIKRLQVNIDDSLAVTLSYIYNCCTVKTLYVSNEDKGQYAEAVTEFVTAVKEACKLVIEDLSAFSDELQEVADKYVAKDTDVTSDIRSQAESI